MEPETPTKGDGRTTAPFRGSETSYRTVFPLGWEPTQDWLTRQHDIDLLLRDVASDLRQGIEEAVRLFKTADSETPGRRRVAEIQRRFPALFPGLAGERVLEGIVTGKPPSLYRHDSNAPAGPSYYMTFINVFEDRASVPASYASTVKENGRTNAWAPRQSWETWSGRRVDERRLPRYRELMRLLDGRAARTHKQIREKYGLTAKQLDSHLARLRKRLGPTLIRCSSDQAEYVRQQQKWAAIVAAGGYTSREDLLGALAAHGCKLSEEDQTSGQSE